MRCGSPGYIAPEVLNGAGYGTKADIFSAGAILCVMLTGVSLFHGKTCEEVILKNTEGNISVYSGYWDPVSDNAKDLVLRMIAKNPETRCTASEALQHPWFSLESTNLTSLSNAQDNMKRYQNDYRFDVGRIKPEEFNIITCTPLLCSRGNIKNSPLLIPDNIKRKAKGTNLPTISQRNVEEKKDNVRDITGMSKVKTQENPLETSENFSEDEINEGRDIDEKTTRIVEKIRSFAPRSFIGRCLPRTPGFSAKGSITYLKKTTTLLTNMRDAKNKETSSSYLQKLAALRKDVSLKTCSILANKNQECNDEQINKASITSTKASKRFGDTPKKL